MSSSRKWTLFATAAALIAPASAMAQAAPEAGEAGAKSEIVVTAQKRAERVVDVPITMSVVSAEQLARQQVNSIQDLTRSSPQISFTSGGEGSPGGGAVVRGIGTQAFSRSASASVGVVVDGVATGNVNITNLFDLARVEVLAGPQGTLFGDSVSAGLISVVTNAPKIGAFEGRFNTEIAPRFDNVGQQVVRGVVNVPLSSIAAARVSGFYNRTEGPTYNVTRKIRQGAEDYGGRIRLLIEPSDNLKVNLIGDYSHSTSDENFFVYVSAAPGSPLPGQLLTNCGITLSSANLSHCGDGPTASKTENWGVSGQIDYTLGDHTLTSITAYRKQTSQVDVDVDGLPAGTSTLQIQSGPERHPASFFTQEFRIASPTHQPVEYVLGAFFSKYDSHHEQPSTVRLIFVPFPLTDGYQTTDTLKKDFAVFGQATVHATPNLNLILGARYNWSTINDVFQKPLQAAPNKGVVNGNVENLSFKLGAQYQFNSNANIYATVTRGYKGPQANDIDLTKTPALVLPEEPMYYEVGSKIGLFGGRMVASADVYYANIKGYQAQYCPPPAINSPVTNCAPQNVNGVKSRGFDLLAFGNVTDDLTVNFGVSYAKATYPKGFFNAQGQDLSGQQLSNSPRWRTVFGAEYTPRLSERAVGIVGLNGDWQSITGFNLSNDPLLSIPARLMLGGRIGVRIDDRYTVTIFGRNLTDNRTPIAAGNGVAFGPEPTNVWRMYTVNSARLIGASLDAKF